MSYQKLTAFYLAAAASVHSQPAPTLSPGLQLVVQQLDRTATAALERGSISFALAAVTRDGIAWSRNYGAGATSDTPYRVGTAAFTAIMLLQLAHESKVHLSDRVANNLPEISRVPARYPDAAPLTLLQLATHNTGLEFEPAASATIPASEWESAVLSALPQTKFATEPGTHVAEAAINDALLALALSRAAGLPYPSYVKQNILHPLGMTHTDFEPAEPLGGGLTIAVRTTLPDLARFAQFEMLGGPDTVLPRAELDANYHRLWLVNSISVPNPSEGVGIGFAGETWTSNRNSHYYFIPTVAAQVPGYRAAFWFEPRTHAGVILLQHGEGPALNEMIHSYVYTLNAQKVDAGSQEPQPPFPYRKENVSFPGSAAGISLNGTLTVPEGKGPFPAIVLVQPLGVVNRDEPLLNHRPFLVLADYLTRKGIAVLRYDTRATRAAGELAADVNAASAFLRNRPEIDPHRIGLLGQGDGGRTAAIAASHDPAIAFLIALSTPAAPELQTLACPVLALYGEKDLNTPTSARLQRAVNPKSRILQLPDLNFLLQTTDTGLGREAVWAEETISPLALEAIVKGIDEFVPRQ